MIETPRGLASWVFLIWTLAGKAKPYRKGRGKAAGQLRGQVLTEEMS